MSATPSRTSLQGRRARKLGQTVQHLADCAWALFAEHGFDAVTMDAIATAADVARGTLYKHFPVKEALIEYRFRQDQLTHEQQVREAALGAPSIEGAFLTILKMESAYVERMQDFIAPYVFYRLGHARATTSPFDNDSFASLAIELIQKGQDTGEITRQIDPLTLAENIIFLRLGAMLRWLRTPDEKIEHLYVEMLQIFLRGAASCPHSSGALP